MIDKNGDAILEASDLVALYSEDLGKRDLTRKK